MAAFDPPHDRTGTTAGWPKLGHTLYSCGCYVQDCASNVSVVASDFCPDCEKPTLTRVIDGKSFTLPFDEKNEFMEKIFKKQRKKKWR